MQAKMQHQSFDKRQAGGFWNTTYITDMSMEVPTADAWDKIVKFVKKHIATKEAILPKQEKSITIERNGMFGLWQFSVITNAEIMLWDISDVSPQETTEKWRETVERWFYKEGFKDYDKPMQIDSIEEVDENTLRVHLIADDYTDGDTVTLKLQ